MKYKIYPVSLAIAAVTAALIAFPANAQVTNGGDDAAAPAVVAPAASTAGSTSNGSDDSAPAVTSTTANVGGGSNTAVTNGADDPSAPSAPATPPGGGGGGGSTISSNTSSGGGGGGGFGGGVSLAATSSTALSASCPLITSYMKLGWNNDPAQVSKLQAFLKDSEKLDVDVNGTFDQKTEAAVESFQRKYMDTVMGPWDATRTTGTVFITTLKKINELACNQPLTLDSEELATIAAYEANAASADNSSSTAVVGVGSSANPTVSLSTTSTSTDVGQVTDGTDNTASVGNVSILQRFWNFLKSLFQ
jgi:hypothetical protein